MSSGPPLSAAATHKHSRVLACVLCQHRKIKCDRNTPCSNCVKANVTCTPSTPAPARKRRRPNQDLQERLARCEELLKQYAGGSNGSSSGPEATSQSQPPSQTQSSTTASSSEMRTDPAAFTPRSTDPYLKWKPTGKMIKEEGVDRFMDSYLWASVYDELRAMKDIIDTDEPEDAMAVGSEDCTPENNADLFFADSATSNIEDLQPDPVHAFRLWQAFLERVNPLTKVIHVPTLQPYVMEAATNMSSIPLHYQGLLFSVYGLATVSLSEVEALQMLGMSRDSALHKFQQGVKNTLSRYNFLKNHNMVVLQALTLYLYSLQGRWDRHAGWIMSGTIVRIAQKMGYHRDGELLNLPPFETEMRRRIWWQIIMQDGKHAMLSGLSHSLLPNRWDTKMPQNVNDADLFPTATEPIHEREGPTEMAFCLAMFQIAKFMISTEQAQPGFEAAILGHELDAQTNPTVNNMKSLEKYRGLVQKLDDCLAEVERKCIDPTAGPVHEAALCIRPMIQTKLFGMLVPMHEQPEWGTEILGPKDNLFKIMLLHNEQNVSMYDSMTHYGFLWFTKLHFQVDVLAVMTGQLAQRPLGSLSDRAWKVIDQIHDYHSELFDMSQRQFVMQAHFTLRAWKARESAFAQSGHPLETPQFIARLRDNAPSSDSRSTSQPALTPPSLAQQHHAQQAAQQQVQHQMQQQAQQQQQQQPQMSDFNLLDGYMDNTLGWDLWGDGNNGGGNPLSAAAFGGFSFGNVV